MPRTVVDPKAPEAVIRLTDFPGMSPGTDQHANPPGASWFQVNAVSLFPGELRVRRGFRVIRFDQPARSRDHQCTATSSYVFAQESLPWVPTDVVVAAASSYVATADAHAGAAFNLMTLL